MFSLWRRHDGNDTVRVTEQGVILLDTKNPGDGPYNDSWRRFRSSPTRG